jgi:hypothetical protein
VASAVFLGFSGVAFVFLMPERPLNERVFMLTFFVAFLFFLFFLLKGSSPRGGVTSSTIVPG